MTSSQLLYLVWNTSKIIIWWWQIFLSGSAKWFIFFRVLGLIRGLNSFNNWIHMSCFWFAWVTYNHFQIRLLLSRLIRDFISLWSRYKFGFALLSLTSFEVMCRWLTMMDLWRKPSVSIKIPVCLRISDLTFELLITTFHSRKPKNKSLSLSTLKQSMANSSSFGPPPPKLWKTWFSSRFIYSIFLWGWLWQV